MKDLPRKKVTYLASVLILFVLMACGLAGGIVETATPEVVQSTQIQIQRTEPSATQTSSPTLYPDGSSQRNTTSQPDSGT
jgi:hypothetical protein